ncbi:Outer membrane efflux protein [compost metagenome]
MKRALVIAMLLLAQVTQAMTLNEYLGVVENKNKNIQALTVFQEEADLNEEAGDLALVPVLTAGASYLSDRSPANQFVLFGANEAKVAQYSLGLGKQFSSGTAIQLSAGVTDSRFPGLSFPGVEDQFTTGTLGIAFSQSLWRDFFGRATRLRWERQKAATIAEKSSYDLQKRVELIKAEGAFWDYMYALEGVRIARSSLGRSKRIETWTRRRVNDGISDRADYLQSQALVSARQLQLVSAEDDLAAAKRQVRDFLELSDSDPFPDLKGDLSQARSLTSFIQGKQGKILELEAYLASLNAKAASVGARETEDAFRPDLVLSGAYNTNSKEDAVDKATQAWLNTDTPTAQVALNFTYQFDTSVKSAAKNAARKRAVAARLQSERKMLESESAWIELNRRYSEMSKRVEEASRLSNLRLSATKAQSDLFNKGRSITSNVVLAEEDAADAELTLTKLQSEQRKMEAQGLLFIVVEE